MSILLHEQQMNMGAAGSPWAGPTPTFEKTSQTINNATVYQGVISGLLGSSFTISYAVDPTTFGSFGIMPVIIVTAAGQVWLLHRHISDTVAYAYYGGPFAAIATVPGGSAPQIVTAGTAHCIWRMTPTGCDLFFNGTKYALPNAWTNNLAGQDANLYLGGHYSLDSYEFIGEMRNIKIFDVDFSDALCVDLYSRDK